MAVTFRRRDNLRGTEAEAKIGEAIRQGFAVLGDDIISSEQQKLPRSNGGKFPRGVDRGTYKRSFRKRMRGRGFRTSMLVFNIAKHAEFLEEGRKPGSKAPPSDALLPWVRRKGLGANAFSVKTRRAISAGTRRTFSRKAGKLRTRAQSLLQIQKSIAFLVARKIGKEGLPGFFVFRDMQRNYAAMIFNAKVGIHTRIIAALNS